MKARLIAVLVISLLIVLLVATAVYAKDNRGPNVQYVDCSQVQNAVGGQYGSATAIGRDATAEVAQELNISQNQVNACLGNIGVDETTEKTDETTEETTGKERSGEETTVVDGQTILMPKGVAADKLPDTGGPTGGGFVLAAGCALLGVGLIANRVIR
jgi:hypothetical protein